MCSGPTGARTRGAGFMLDEPDRLALRSLDWSQFAGDDPVRLNARSEWSVVPLPVHASAGRLGADLSRRGVDAQGAQQRDDSSEEGARMRRRSIAVLVGIGMASVLLMPALGGIARAVCGSTGLVSWWKADGNYQ